MKISIVILNFKNAKTTLDCLESLKKIKLSDKDELETIVVDNASDGSLDSLLKDKFKDVVLIEKKENLGFTGGCNTGMEYALKNGADYVILLNNDTIVDENLVKNLLSSLNDNVGGIVPKIYFAKGFEFHKGRYKEKDIGKVLWYAGGIMDWNNLIGKNRGVDEVDNGQYDRREETDLATGCCFLIKSEVLKKIGLFDDKFFLYYEDADLTQRIKRAGYKIIYEPKAFLWHKNAESSGGSGSKLQDYFITRNRLLFGIRYAPLRTKLALVRESINLILKGREWQKKGATDYYLGRFGRGSYNI